MSLRSVRGPAGRWFLPVLLLFLVLGHVCELSAFAHLDPHHPVDGETGAPADGCDPAPARSSAGQAQSWSWWIAGVPVALPAVGAVPAGTPEATIDAPALLLERPRLFLLYATLLI